MAFVNSNIHDYNDARWLLGDEAVLLGTRVLVMSPRPGRIVFDEPSPFGPDVERGRDLRLHPDFVPFRESVAAAIELPPVAVAPG